MGAIAEAPARDVVVLRLAEGGMGYVELVARREGRFLRLFARKRLHPHLRAEAAFRSMFIDEARLAGLIRHPNVAAVLEIGDDEDGPFLLMDYVEGPSVAEIVERVEPRDAPLPVALCVSIAAQAARGLDAAHRLLAADGTPLGVVHRDISPKNLLVGYDGLVRVADFGIAKAKDNLAETRVGVLKGNIGYMAPEYLRFQDLDGRSDLFSLGVVLYEMLARERLYAGDDVPAIARRIVDEPPPDIFDVRDVPPELVSLLFDMLAKDRELRPSSALEVATRLDAIAASIAAIDGAFDVSAFLESELGSMRQERQLAVDEALTTLPARPNRTWTDVGIGPAPRARRWPRIVAPIAALALLAAFATWKVATRRAPITFVPGAAALWSGGWHQCAMRGQRLVCWGSNSKGQVGDGTTQNRTTPVVVPLDGVRAVAMGEYHTCALVTDGRVFCWGRNVRSEVGGPVPAMLAKLPQEVEGLGPATALAAGRQHTCARLASGAVYCWGANESGQLGRPLSDDGLPPGPVPGLPAVTQIFAGGSNTCARLASGALVCWGANESGQLGDDSRAARPTPAPLPFSGVPDMVGLAIGNGARAGSRRPDLTKSAAFMCALTRAGTVLCWGNNGTAQLGDGTRENRATPTPVPGVAEAIEVDVGDQHACALRRSGRISCWGRNEFGAVGDDTMGPSTVRLNAADALGIDDAVGLALGGAHSCARLRNGGVLCWGVNNYGQLGDGTTTLHPAPHVASDLP
jgi:serine/threonine-protein kinase